jgi:hypothetical protein
MAWRHLTAAEEKVLQAAYAYAESGNTNGGVFAARIALRRAADELVKPVPLTAAPDRTPGQHWYEHCRCSTSIQAQRHTPDWNGLSEDEKEKWERAAITVWAAPGPNIL